MNTRGDTMLLNFNFSNYRSFRDDTKLSMSASGLHDYQENMLVYRKERFIPVAAIYGKNGGGKSNVIRAFWLGVQFIRNAQRTQHESASIPVRPFLLNDYSQEEPSIFEYTYICNDIKYIYGFSASREKIFSEYLFYYPKGQRSKIFTRNFQNFNFPINGEKNKKELISQAVAENQLFFSVACTMNYLPCIEAMKWFRDYLFFSRDFNDIPKQLFECAEDPNMLQAITKYAQDADVGVSNILYEIKNRDLNKDESFPEGIPEGIKVALNNFMKALSSESNEAESELTMSELQARAFHKGKSKDGKNTEYALGLEDESDGTRKIMAYAPAIEKALLCGGVFVVDELDRGMHPLLIKYIISKFQNPKINKKNAQMIFTTHDTELLSMTMLRKDQIFFVDKHNDDGVSELYKVMDYSPKTNDNIRKKYLAGVYGATPELDIEEM